MPVSVVIDDAHWTYRFASMTLPFLEDLVDEYLFGTSDVLTVPNRAAPARPLVKIGAPTYGASYARFGSPDGSALNGYDSNSPLVESDMTLLTVLRKGGAAGMAPIGSAAGSPVGFGQDSGVWCAYNSQSFTAAQLADLPLPDNANFLFYAATLPLGAVATFHRFVAGVRSGNVSESPGGLTRPGTDLLFGFTNPGSVGLTDVAWFAKFGRILTLPEIDEAYAQVKYYMANFRSLAVS